jgi:hypothetical protein
MAQITTNSKYALGALRMPEPQGAETLTVLMRHALAVNPGAGDVAWLGDLPPGAVPTEVILSNATQIDSNGAPTMTCSVGILNAAKTALATTWISAATTLRTAGGNARPAATSSFYSTAASSSAQSIGVSFPAVAATFVAGNVDVLLEYRAVHGGQ